jgi:hypothetical protein
MIVCDGGTAYVIGSNGSVLRLREKDAASKIQVLVNKSLFSMALSLAAEEQCGIIEIARLHEVC